MVARSDVAERALHSTDHTACLRAVRDIRNMVIGDKQKKRVYVGVVEQILQILDTSADSNLKCAAAAVVGSISYRNEAGLKAIVNNRGVDVLLKAFSDDDVSVVEAAARALKLVYQVRCRQLVLLHCFCSDDFKGTYACSPRWHPMSPY
jgi:hypothetical protein